MEKLVYLFSRKNITNFHKYRIYFMKLLESFEETKSILKKFTENFKRDFKNHKRNLKTLCEKSGKFGVSIFKKEYKKSSQILNIFYEIIGKF